MSPTLPYYSAFVACISLYFKEEENQQLLKAKSPDCKRRDAGGLLLSDSKFLNQLAIAGQVVFLQVVQ